MNKICKFSVKTAMLSALLSAAFVTPAQIYQNDYTTIHIDPNEKQWVEQHAIYRDDNEKAYYIAQGLRPRDGKETYLGLTKCDADMNIIQVWEYFNESKKMEIRTETIDEMYGLDALILVGHYDDHNGVSAPFVMSINKFSGGVNWFRFFPTLELTSLEAEKDYVLVTGKRPLKYGEGIHAYSASAALIMRLDYNGDLVWEREFEDNKYDNGIYDVKQVYNIMNDIKRLDDKYFVAVGATNNWVFKEKPENTWDNDGLVVLIDEYGNVNYAVFLGNLLPYGVDKQGIQYELLDHVTIDKNDKTVVIAGERLDHPQWDISDESPVPDQWGLWVTKFDPYNVSLVWSYRYQFKDEFYRISDPEIEHDTKSRYGISYNFPKLNPMVMKLKDDGSVMYHRRHFISGYNSGNMQLNDITTGLDYAWNMTVVGEFEPDVNEFWSSWGWNIQAFDNILEKCEMEEYDIKPKEAPYELDKVEWREYKVDYNKEG
ncbi:MAG: hypothetical protein K0R82_2995, partial [Flavipsychrobacter sp.]|nr:hypothetical protein [Flavipsychrobacter sp.]